MRKFFKDNVTIVNSGKFEGKLNGIGPMLFINRVGGGKKYQNSGLYELDSSDKIGMQLLTGLLLPLSKCQNESIQDIFLSLRKFTTDGSLYNRKEQASKTLSSIRDYDIALLKGEPPHGGFSLEPETDCLRMLCDHFEYVNQLTCFPNGQTIPTSFSKFRWRTYGELMEWFHTSMGRRLEQWEPINIHLMFEGMVGVEYLGEIATLDTISYSELTLEKFFCLKPDVRPSRIDFQSKVYGPAYGDFSIIVDGKKTVMFLSDAFPPYRNLINWLQEVDNSRIPVRVELEEEGPSTFLEAHPTGDKNSILFLYGEIFGNTLYIQTVVNRINFVQGFRKELARFIINALDTNKYDIMINSSLKSIYDEVFNSKRLFSSATTKQK